MAVSFAVLPMSSFSTEEIAERRKRIFTRSLVVSRTKVSLLSLIAATRPNNTTNGNNGIAYFNGSAHGSIFLVLLFWGRYRMMYMNTRIRTIGRKVTSRLAVLEVSAVKNSIIIWNSLNFDFTVFYYYTGFRINRKGVKQGNTESA